MLKISYPFPKKIEFKPTIPLNTKDIPSSEGDQVVAPIIVKIVYSYPFKKELLKEYMCSGSDGFTFKELHKIVCSEYQKLYKEEANQRVSLSNTQKVPNPYKTPYGIWGPNLDELSLGGIIVQTIDEDNIPILRPIIDDGII